MIAPRIAGGATCPTHRGRGCRPYSLRRRKGCGLVLVGLVWLRIEEVRFNVVTQSHCTWLAPNAPTHGDGVGFAPYTVRELKHWRPSASERPQEQGLRSPARTRNTAEAAIGPLAGNPYRKATAGARRPPRRETCTTNTVL